MKHWNPFSFEKQERERERERERGLCFKGLLCRAVFFPHFVITLVVFDFRESKDEFGGVE